MKWRSLAESTPGTEVRSLQRAVGRAKRADRKICAGGDSGHSRPSDRGAEAARHCVARSGSGRNGPQLSVKGSERKPHFLSSTAGARASRDLLFHGRWCPFWVTQLEAINLVVPEIARAGASLVAI